MRKKHAVALVGVLLLGQIACLWWLSGSGFGYFRMSPSDSGPVGSLDASREFEAMFIGGSLTVGFPRTGRDPFSKSYPTAASWDADFVRFEKRLEWSSVLLGSGRLTANSRAGPFTAEGGSITIPFWLAAASVLLIASLLYIHLCRGDTLKIGRGDQQGVTKNQQGRPTAASDGDQPPN